MESNNEQPSESPSLDEVNNSTGLENGFHIDETKSLFEKLLETVPKHQLLLFEEFVSDNIAATKVSLGLVKEEKACNDNSCTSNHGKPSSTSHNQNKQEDPNDQKMLTIIEELRATVPVTAEAPGEKIFIPKTPEFEGWNARNTVHVDSFLYSDDDAIDDLCDEGRLSRYYCEKCGSKRIAPLNFISHSASLSQLKFIFSEDVLGNLEGKTVVDVGSRLGAVLYAGYYYSKASTIVGIEKNKWFCDLQNQFINKKNHKMTDRVKVICDDIMNQADMLAEADVVVMNNVFEFFVSQKKLLLNLWSFVKQTIKKKGCKIITIPAIEQSLESAGLELDLEEWVKPIPLKYPQVENEDEQEDYEMIFMYEVVQNTNN